jgi:hypothetical protein
MTDGAYAPPCGRLHSDKVLALINKFVYHVRMALFGSVRIRSLRLSRLNPACGLWL